MSTPDEPVLLPCPFCGGPGTPPANDGQYAFCRRCDVLNPDPPENDTKPFTIARACELWNMRTPLPPSPTQNQGEVVAAIVAWLRALAANKRAMININVQGEWWCNQQRDMADTISCTADAILRGDWKPPTPGETR